MSDRFDALLVFLRRTLIEPLGRLGALAAAALPAFFAAGWRSRRRLVIAAVLAALAYGLYHHPPFATVRRDEVLVRTNLFDGSANAYTAGTVLVLPGIHQVHRYSTRDQMYRPTEGTSARPRPLSIERGPVDRRRSDGTLGHRPRAHRLAVRRASRRPQCGSGAPGGAGNRLPAARAACGAGDFLERARADPAGDRHRARTEARRRRAGAAGSRHGQGGSAGGVPRADGEAPRRGARDREGPLHPRAQGGAGEGDAARGRSGQGAAREGGRGGGRGTGDRLARAGGDHEAHPALQAEADRTAPARGARRRRSRASAPRKARPRRAASRRGARPTRARSSPMRRRTGSTSSARRVRARWSARGPCSRIIRS